MIEHLSNAFSQLASNRLITILIESFPKMLLPGLKMTIPLTAISFSIALVIAVAAAMIQVAKIPVLRQLVRGVFRTAEPGRVPGSIPYSGAGILCQRGGLLR